VITLQYAQNFSGGTITVNAFNACGAGGNRSRTVSINNPSTPGNISGPTDGLCGATNVTYSVNSLSGVNSYIWTVPAGATIVGNATGNSIVVNFSNVSVASGNITVAAINGCGTGNARSLAVKFAPGRPGSINGATTVCTGSSKNYSISTVQGATSYIWTVPGGATITSGQGSKSISVVHATVPSTNGIITVKASNACATSTARVLSVNNIVCPRNGEFGSISMIAYPNPAHDVLNVEFTSESDETAIVKMIDAAGRLIYTESFNATSGANRKSIQVADFAKGIYLIQVEMNNQIEKLRVIVE